MIPSLDKADRALRRFDGERALAAYSAILATGKDPDDRATVGRVRALWLLRRWDEARAALPRHRETAHTWLALGGVALGQPDYAPWLAVDCGSGQRLNDEALKAFENAITLAPDNAEAVAGLGTALRMSGRPTEARKVLLAAHEKVRESAPVQVELAMCESELEDYDAAAKYARHALGLDPDYLHASLVLLELARRTRPGSVEVVEDAATLAHAHPVPVVRIMHGWTLYDTGREDLERKAFDEFNESGKLQPSAIHGMHRLGLDSLLASHLRNQPDSPLLRRCVVEWKLGEDSRPETRLAKWQAVLASDSRYLDARLAVADALADLDRTDEARKIISPLRTELPGNTRVTRAWARLETPWRMPEADDIRTRVERPWESGRDDRKAVLDMLVDEVTTDLQLNSTVIARLQSRLRPDAVHQYAFDDEQAYLKARAEHNADSERTSRLAPIKLVGTTLILLTYTAVYAAAAAFYWLLLDLLGTPVLLQVGAALALGLAGLLYLVLRTPKAVEVVINIVMVPAGLAGPFWLGIRLFGTGPGIGAAVGFYLLLAVAASAGDRLRIRYGPPAHGQLQKAFDRWAESLYGRSVLPAAAEASSPETLYRITLPAQCRILSEEPADLDTPAIRELRRLLRQRNQGSFALAGPRGAGKSTLMIRWRDGHFLPDSNTDKHLTVKVDAPVGYQSQEFLQYLFGRVCAAVECYLGPPTPTQRARRLVPWQKIAVAPAETSADDLRQRAAQERENIRYIRSRTTEGELSVGVPVLGGKSKVSVKRDDVPLNHPELVDRFREFLRAAAEFVSARKGKVLIGIDELDRISNGDDAQRFINELKAVFTVPNCFFLVSVSEDALADFELAAMGTRTVFDSAFDTIVRVDYLGFTQARALLNRRIIDLPEQFAALAYVMSGGLARELARLAEEIGDDRVTESRELGEVTAQLVQRQLSRTTRAAADRLSRSEDRRAGAVLIPVLDEHPRDRITAAELHAYAAQVVNAGKPDDDPELVAGVRLDIVVMIRYLAMLLQVFDNDLTEERMAIGRARGLGDFETLARVRRYLGANPHGALALLGAFTKAWQLPDGR